MSLLDKVKGWGRGPGHDHDPGHASVFDEEAMQPHAGDAYGDTLRPGRGGAATLDLGNAKTVAVVDTSIISEAAPSEMAGDFSESRIPADVQASALTSGLPLIGKRPVAEQQRLLLVLGAVGALGL